MKTLTVRRVLCVTSVLVALAAAVAVGVYLTGRERFIYAVGDGEIWQVRLSLLLRPSLIRTRLNDGFTPLHVAAIAHDPPMIDCLVRHGADLDARAERGTEIFWIPVQHAQGGERPLHCALWKEDPVPTVERLLSDGADPNASDDDGSTPLHLAACMGQANAVRVLVANGAAVNAIDDAGHTPLHAAVWCGAKELLPGQSRVVAILLENGANPQAQDSEGNTPLALARKTEREVRGWLGAQGWGNPDTPARLKSRERAAIISILEAASSERAE